MTTQFVLDCKELQTLCGLARRRVDVRGSSDKDPINFGPDTTWW
jgi:hypothetical protein